MYGALGILIVACYFGPMVKDDLPLNEGYHAEYGFHRGMLHLQNVPGFEWIYIHPLTNEKQTDGCIGVGYSAHSKGGFEIARSKEAYVDLYKLVFPNWDEIAKVDGYPQIGLVFWTFIHHRFLDFDRMFHPDVMAAGAWMNWGFSCNRRLKDWEISFENCSIQ